MCAQLIIVRFNVSVPATIVIDDKVVYVYTGISKVFFFPFHECKQMFTQICAAKHQTYLEVQLNKFWK